MQKQETKEEEKQEESSRSLSSDVVFLDTQIVQTSRNVFLNKLLDLEADNDKEIFKLWSGLF